MTRILLLTSLLAAASCTDVNVRRNNAGVVSLSGGHTARISADDLVIVLGRSGFSPDEILEHGPGVRNALAMRGGAEVRKDGQVVAMMSVLDGALYVVSQRGGSYVHDLYE
ncbi:hypothetical protein [Jannaschia seohaensis]|uniref:Uncharacterized protein n=1 Tax=Jannaschia seohaensis TaxID=475081 RepID=A0A2Y9AFG1_9RHOB|nr:hypothetical protein [Jannaschia seohaensis]PWJ21412.1 hypothetical protein BCF38_102665 [Jannaschia seohaensis]SSA42018.1 hypothetical protein SAMN05421539_102665 [Jannaschia seohaensis]